MRRVQEATKFWGERAFIERFSYEFSKGERLGVVGPNGAGKSTLLDLLAGLSSPDEGERILGDTSVVGYFAQHPPPVNPKLRIIDYISSIVDTSCAPPPACCTHHALQICCTCGAPARSDHNSLRTCFQLAMTARVRTRNSNFGALTGFPRAARRRTWRASTCGPA